MKERSNNFFYTLLRVFIVPKGLWFNQFHLKKNNEKQATSAQHPEKIDSLTPRQCRSSGL